MPASIFNGNAVKILKNNLRFKSLVEIITGDSDDPTVTAKDAPQGSLYIRDSAGEVYIKKDAGSSTNWDRLLDFADIGSFATTALDNLSSTAINQDLIPQTTNSVSLGSSTMQWLRGFVGNVTGDTHTETGTLTGDVTSGSDLITNVTGDQTFFESGYLVTGTGIPANTVAFRQSANSFRLVNFSLVSVNATATNLGVTITWTNIFGVALRTLAKPSTGTSGTMIINTGRTVDNVSGDVRINTGTSFRSSGAGSGTISLVTGTSGNESGTATSGAVSVASGRSYGTGLTGLVFLGSGAAFSSGGTGATVVQSGGTNGGNSGATSVLSGNSLSGGNTGTTSISTGTTTTGTSGNTSVTTGNSSSGGTTGNISLTTGTTSGTRGTISATGGSITLTAANSSGNITLAPGATGFVDVSSKLVSNVANPVSSNDAVNLSYAQANFQPLLLSIQSVSSNITLVANAVSLVNTSAPRALVLPSSADGNQVILKDISGLANTNNITLTSASGNIDGSASLVISSNYAAYRFVRSGGNWFVI